MAMWLSERPAEPLHRNNIKKLCIISDFIHNFTINKGTQTYSGASIETKASA